MRKDADLKLVGTEPTKSEVNRRASKSRTRHGMEGQSKNPAMETARPLQPLTGERSSGESDRAVVACNDWLRMGVGRSLGGLLTRYTTKPRETPPDPANLAHSASPTDSLHTLEGWAKAFSWASRARMFDSLYEEEKNAQRRAIMESGLALDYNRVSKLQNLADFLEDQIYKMGPNHEGVMVHHNIWLHDVKSIGSGESVERVDIKRYNGSLITSYLAVLDDIAQETGGRRMKDQSAAMTDALIKKVGLDNMPREIVSRLAGGEELFPIVIDAIKLLTPPAEKPTSSAAVAEIAA